jgi:integrase/recombinase XerD
MAVKALDECPKLHERYWFWTAQGTVETARKKWSEALAKIFRDAKVKEGHAHRFRDTFAVELLKAGTPIENVAAFLGHASIRVTQKHYSAWVKARQIRAEADVMASWESDSVLAMTKPTRGAPEVHGKREAVN